MTEPQPPVEPTRDLPPEPPTSDAVPPAAPDDATEPVRLDPDALAELLPPEDVAGTPDAVPAETMVVAPVAAPTLPPAGPPPGSPAPVAAPTAVPAVTSTSVAVVPRRTWPSTIGRIVAFLFGILQALLILRIGLLFLNANQENDIVAWVLSVTDPFVEPFRGMFQLDEVTGAAGSVLDIAAVVALIAWSLIETLILSILRLFGRRG
jgi:uncharacterized protein YggT (Ycf19 family)